MLSKVLFLLLISIPVSATEIKVLIIDTGIASTNFDLQQYTVKEDVQKYPESYSDYNGHGTHVASSIIKNVCKEVKLYSCMYYSKWDSDDVNWNRLLDCYKRAQTEQFDYVNFSSGGSKPLTAEYENIRDILKPNKTVMVVSAGNDGVKLGNPCWGFFPACYKLKNMLVVGNVDENGPRPYNKAPTSNYGLKDMKWASGTRVLSGLPDNRIGYMSGTSMATANYTNYLLKERCKEIK